MKNNKKDKNPSEKDETEDKEGLNLYYDKKELNEFIPHLMTEISNKKQSMKINSISNDNDEIIQNQYECLPNELINPGAIDFIRRCTKNEEAFEILDYLLKRNELNREEYNFYKKRIMKKGGLKAIIKESGGPKRPGYYIKKYYKKDCKNQN